MAPLSLLAKPCASLARALYGEDALKHETASEAGVFSALLCFVVGIYWMMRSLKDSVFATLIGLKYQPQAKMLSLVVCVSVLFVYNKVVDLAPRRHLFTVVCGGYACLFMGIAACLLSPSIGLAAVGADGRLRPPSPDRWLGWVHYFAIESYGSLAVSLFWQYTNSQVTLKDAKAQYGIIVAGGQVGAITGCTLVVGSKQFGVAQLYGLGGLLTLVAPVIVHFHHERFGRTRAAHAVAPAAAMAPQSGGDASTKKAEKVTPGLFEGLRLLLQHPYVLGIFAVSALFEVIATILDYQMKVLGKASHASTADFAAFMGLFGQATNTVSLVFSLLGTSFVIRTLGVRLSLMLFPAMLIVTVCIVWSAPSMWVLFAVMVSIKGLAYALNNPSKEMLYMATTDSIKFKAKSWIDVFGGRASKALGSIVTNTFKNPVENLMYYGSIVSLSIAAALLVIAAMLGAAFERLTATGDIIGMEEHAGDVTPAEMRSLTLAEEDGEASRLGEEPQRSPSSQQPVASSA